MGALFAGAIGVLRMSAEILTLSADACAICYKSGPSGDNCFNAERGRPVPLGSVQPFGFYGHMECQRRFQHRHRDVRYGVRLVDNEHRPEPDDGLPRTGCCQPAPVPFHFACGSAGGRSRFPAVAHRSRNRDLSGIRYFRWLGLYRPRHTNTLVSHDLLTWRRRGAHVASLGRHPSHARAEGGS